MELFKEWTCCLVCGYDFQEPVSIDDDCPCCGGFQGYYRYDEDPEFIKGFRNGWLNKGAPWGDGKTHQPKGWNKEMALEQIKKNVPEKFQ